MIRYIPVVMAVFVSCSSITINEAGYIEGRTSYPGEWIPRDMIICAENIDTKEVIQMKPYESLNSDGSGGIISFKLTVPEGRYYVYATFPNVQYRAYYTESSLTGYIFSENISHKPIIVVVVAKKTTSNINPGDWYNNR